MSGITTNTISATRQAELRAIRVANEEAKRPPYAWARLTVEDITWLIVEHGWSVTDEAGPRVDLSGARLANINLAGAKLRFAQFKETTLFGADLRGTDLFYAHFDNADMREIQADGANLEMARMRGARLYRAQLVNAQLKQAWLPEADLSEAKLDGANLSGVRGEQVDLHESSLVGANLSWARLQEADLRGATLKGAVMRSIQLERAQLDSADLTGADLQGAWCDDAMLFAARLDGADLRGARFPRAQLGNATLTGARLAGIDLRDVDLTRVTSIDQFATTPTGDEIAAHALTGDTAAKAVALRDAAFAVDRLALALDLSTTTDGVSQQRMRQRSLLLRRSAAKLTATSFSGRLRTFADTVGFGIIGTGDAPMRIALWAAALVVLVAALTLLLPSLTDAHDLGASLSLALTGITTPGYGSFAQHATGTLRVIGAIESVIGDGLAAIFIAAVVRRTNR